MVLTAVYEMNVDCSGIRRDVAAGLPGTGTGETDVTATTTAPGTTGGETGRTGG